MFEPLLPIMIMVIIRAIMVTGRAFSSASADIILTAATDLAAMDLAAMDLAVMDLRGMGLRGMAAVIMGNTGAEPVRSQINSRS
jgi:hypothetical protein